jgi:tellurite methyltransferase
MNHPDALRWNDRYTTEAEEWLSHSPKRLLMDFIDLIPTSGIALDAAAGVVTNGLELARKGLYVVALDISWVALHLAKQRFVAQGLRLDAAVYDLAHPWLPMDYFDVILNFQFLERATFPVYRYALKPGGLIFFQTFVKHPENPDNPDYYLEPGELQNAFRGFVILHYGQDRLEKDGGFSRKMTEQIVARKPQSQTGDSL